MTALYWALTIWGGVHIYLAHDMFQIVKKIRFETPANAEGVKWRLHIYRMTGTLAMTIGICGLIAGWIG